MREAKLTRIVGKISCYGELNLLSRTDRWIELDTKLGCKT